MRFHFGSAAIAILLAASAQASPIPTATKITNNDGSQVAGVTSGGGLVVTCVSGCGGSGGTASTFGIAFPAQGTAAGAENEAGIMVALRTATSTPAGGEEALLVRLVGAGGGGTSSNFGSAFPAAGTAAGANNRAGNMVGLQTSTSTPAGTEEALITRVNGTVTVTGTVTAANASVSTTGSAVPASATFAGAKNEAGNLVGLQTSTTTPIGTEEGLIVRPIGTQTITGTVAQGNTGSNAQAWWMQLGDTSRGPVAVKAASTAVAAADVALAVSLSPNSSSTVIGHVLTDTGSTTAVTGNVTVVQGTGTNLHTVVDSGAITVSGTVTTTPPANASTNVTQFGSSNVSTGTGAGGAGIPRVTVSRDSQVIPWDGTTNITIGTTGAPAFNSGVSTTLIAATISEVASSRSSPYATMIAGWNDSATQPTVPVVEASNSAPAGFGMYVLPSVAVTSASSATNGRSVALQQRAADGRLFVTNDASVAQGSTTAGEVGELVQGAATTSSPVYVGGQTAPLSLDLNGNLRVTGVISGTVTSTNASVGADGAAALSSDTQIGGKNEANNLVVLRTATSTPTGAEESLLVKVNGPLPAGTNVIGHAIIDTGSTTAVTQATGSNLHAVIDSGTITVSGTVTANIGTTNGLALDTSVTGLQVAQGSSTSGEKGGLVLGAVTTSAPSYTTAQSSPLSLQTDGSLRVAVTAGGGSNASVGTTGSAVPSSATLVGGKNEAGNLLPLQTSTTTPLGTEEGLIVRNIPSGTQGINVAQVNGVTVLTGAGTAGTGTQRVAVADSDGVVLATANSGRLQVDVVTGGGSNASVGTTGSAVPSSATLVGGKNVAGNLIALPTTTSTPTGLEDALVVRIAGAAAGGTSSNFGSAFPGAGTAAGQQNKAGVMVALYSTTSTPTGTEEALIVKEGLLGQQTSINSKSVVLASDYVPLDVTAGPTTISAICTNSSSTAGTCPANSTVSITTTGQAFATVEISPATWTCTSTVADYLSADGTQWVSGGATFGGIGSAPDSTSISFTASSTTSTTSIYAPDGVATSGLRVRCSAPSMTNTATVTMRAGTFGWSPTPWAAPNTGSASSTLQGLSVGGVVSTSAPTYTTGSYGPLSMDTAGNVRVNIAAGGSAPSDTSTTGTISSACVDGSINSCGANSTVAVQLTGDQGCGFVINSASSTWVGTAVVDFSMDNGTTWTKSTTIDTTGAALSSVTIASGTAYAYSIAVLGGARQCRVRGSVVTSGSATVTAIATNAWAVGNSIQGIGVAGTPAGGVMSVQGVTSGTALGVIGTTAQAAAVGNQVQTAPAISRSAVSAVTASNSSALSVDSTNGGLNVRLMDQAAYTGLSITAVAGTIGNGAQVLPAIARASPTADTVTTSQALQVSSVNGNLFTSIAGATAGGAVADVLATNTATSSGAGVYVVPGIGRSAVSGVTAGRVAAMAIDVTTGMALTNLSDGASYLKASVFANDTTAALNHLSVGPAIAKAGPATTTAGRGEMLQLDTVSGGAYVTESPTTAAVGLTTTGSATVTSSVNFKASAGNLYGFGVVSGATSGCWLQCVNSSGAGTLGTAVIFQAPLPNAGTVYSPPGPIPLGSFSTGIACGVATAVGGGSACGTSSAIALYYK